MKEAVKQKAKQEEQLSKYNDLAKELSADVGRLKDLWREREELFKEEANATKKRAEISSKLFDCKTGENGGVLRTPASRPNLRLSVRRHFRFP